MKKILTVFGTRPEAIKMCPLVKALRESKALSCTVCVTGQHRSMLDGVLRAFGVCPEYDLGIMREGQTLFDVTERVMSRVRDVMERERPDTVLVHGDTTGAMATALAAYYLHIPIGHVEAGLRTYNKHEPFPEELNRRLIAQLADLHFAPTEQARRNLLSEHVESKRIFVTGNTVLDAMAYTVREGYCHPVLQWAGERRILLVTLHRRESWGEPMRSMLAGLCRALSEHSDACAILPMHCNPVVREVIHEMLDGCPQVLLTEPPDVVDFHNWMARSYLILTDSGGIQEEAPSLGVPVLVLRNATERTEGVEAGALRLVGTDGMAVYRHTNALLENKTEYESMKRASAHVPFGGTGASAEIVRILSD